MLIEKPAFTRQEIQFFRVADDLFMFIMFNHFKLSHIRIKKCIRVNQLKLYWDRARIVFLHLMCVFSNFYLDLISLRIKDTYDNAKHVIVAAISPVSCGQTSKML